MVSADETCPSYEEIIMNMIAGHSFLSSTFGMVPKHAWQIDAYGHSASTPELLSKMGFETVSFARITQTEKDRRKEAKELEFMWEGDFEGENHS